MLCSGVPVSSRLCVLRSRAPLLNNRKSALPPPQKGTRQVVLQRRPRQQQRVLALDGAHALRHQRRLCLDLVALVQDLGLWFCVGLGFRVRV